MIRYKDHMNFLELYGLTSWAETTLERFVGSLSMD